MLSQPFQAAYLHVFAESGVGAKQDLALLVGTVVHARQLVREAHCMLAPGVSDQQTGADLGPGRAKRQADLKMYLPSTHVKCSAPGKDAAGKQQDPGSGHTRLCFVCLLLFFYLAAYGSLSKGNEILATLEGPGNTTTSRWTLLRGLIKTLLKQITAPFKG